VRLVANFATRFVNTSYRTRDVERKRFATSHVRSTLVNRHPGLDYNFCRNYRFMLVSLQKHYDLWEIHVLYGFTTVIMY